MKKNNLGLILAMIVGAAALIIALSAFDNSNRSAYKADNEQYHYTYRVKSMDDGTVINFHTDNLYYTDDVIRIGEHRYLVLDIPAIDLKDYQVIYDNHVIEIYRNSTFVGRVWLDGSTASANRLRTLFQRDNR